MNSKLYYVLLFSIIFVQTSLLSSQNRTLRLEIEGKKYEQLYLEATVWQVGIGAGNRLVAIQGSSDDGSNWSFSISDSLDQTVRYYQIKYGPYDFATNTDYYIGFLGTFDGRRLYTNDFVYDSKMPVFRLEYDTTIVDEMNFAIVGDTIAVENPKITQDVFRLDIDIDDSEIEPIMKHSDFGIFSRDEEGYKGDFANCVSIIEQYPNSKYLFGNLAYFKGGYRRKADVELLFNLFTEGRRQSYFGDIIREYLKFDPSLFDFDNCKLTSSADRTKQENIIIDRTKYTLVVFSASWCGPCHKRIPLLKEIYNEKGDEVNIVYISIDDESTIAVWDALLKKESIPWRSLLLLNDEYEIRKKYHISSIPNMILVHPQGKAMKVDLYDEQSKEAIYQKIVW